MTTLDRNGPGYRAAQMGRVTGALVVLAVVLLLAAVAALVVQGPGADAVVSTVLLPVDVELRRPGMAMVLAVAALVAATPAAIAGLQTASAMQVLSRERRAPNPLPVPARRARRWLLGPVAMRTCELDRVHRAGRGIRTERSRARGCDQTALHCADPSPRRGGSAGGHARLTRRPGSPT